MHILAGTGNVELIKLLMPFVKEESMSKLDKDGKKPWERAIYKEVQQILKPKEVTKTA